LFSEAFIPRSFSAGGWRSRKQRGNLILYRESFILPRFLISVMLNPESSSGQTCFSIWFLSAFASGTNGVSVALQSRFYLLIPSAWPEY
jgi:hypothetical protein